MHFEKVGLELWDIRGGKCYLSRSVYFEENGLEVRNIRGRNFNILLVK